MSTAPTRLSPRLTHAGALQMLEAAMARAVELDAPVNIVIVDEGGRDLLALRMDGAKFLSMETARSKAMTAASHRRPTTQIAEDLALKLAIASGSRLTNMAGGLPIVIEETCVGGIGIGSALDEDDIRIARAALLAIGARDFG